MPDAVVVEISTVAATRAALAHNDDRPVVGWVDLSSPHLVDLLDELLAGQGGDRLVALCADLTSEQLDDLPIQRGLNTLHDANLGFHTLDPGLRQAIQARHPLLRLHP